MEEPNDLYGLELNTAYDVAHKFLSDKIEKAFHPSFDERVLLSALSLQSKFGNYDSSKTSGVGMLDFSGQRRIRQWQSLCDMKPEAAKSEFIRLIKKLCPLFPTYLASYAKQVSGEAVADGGAKTGTPESQTMPINTPTKDHLESLETIGTIILQNEQEIRSALNAQTKDQFEAYAMQHYPGDSEKRKALIAELQDRHFHEYTAYIEHQRAAVHPQPTAPKPGPDAEEMVEGGWVYADVAHVPPGSEVPNAVPQSPNGPTPSSGTDQPEAASHCSPADASPDDGVLSPDESCHSFVRVPSMWTRGEVAIFKENLANTKDAVVSIGCGEMITIRVPTYPSGSSIVWEFATDDYDIGFGLFFEWSDQGVGEHSPGAPETKVLDTASTEESVQTDRSEEKSDAVADNQAAVSDADRPESSASGEEDSAAPPLVEEIIPVFRRSCHQEVYCGTHPYPGAGTYLFKFDNSYSLWRSKVLYYRVYYTC